MGERWIAQRALSREFLHWNVPVGELPSHALSASSSVTFTIAPELAGFGAADGLRVLEPWGTFLHYEVDDRIEWSGIVTDSEWLGSRYEVTVASFSRYPHGMPWIGNYLGVETDPANVMRYIWQALQKRPDADLGVQVLGSTRVRLGSKSSERARVAKAAEDAARKRVDAAREVQSKANTTAERNAARAVVEARRRDLEKAQEVRKAADEAERDDGGEYRFDWWDNDDCGREIDRLAREAPFDWVEEHEWNDQRTDVVHRIRVADRIGARRTDLRFAVGENVVEATPFLIDGDWVANEVIGVGAGEGKKALRESAAVRDGRLRRIALLEWKDIRAKPRLQSMVRTEQQIRAMGTLGVESVIVQADHSHAPVGSWRLGDEILVQGDLPWLGRTGVWARVKTWERVGGNKARLGLVPSWE